MHKGTIKFKEALEVFLKEKRIKMKWTKRMKNHVYLKTKFLYPLIRIGSDKWKELYSHRLDLRIQAVADSKRSAFARAFLFTETPEGSQYWMALNREFVLFCKQNPDLEC
jgi:hypothetical protein